MFRRNPPSLLFRNKSKSSSAGPPLTRYIQKTCHYRLSWFVRATYHTHLFLCDVTLLGFRYFPQHRSCNILQHDVTSGWCCFLRPTSSLQECILSTVGECLARIFLPFVSSVCTLKSDVSRNTGRTQRGLGIPYLSPLKRLRTVRRKIFWGISHLNARRCWDAR